MPNLIVTDTEVKSYLGVSGSTLDTFITMANKMATQRLCKLLGVRDLTLHKVTEEVHDGGLSKYELKDLNVRAIGEILEDEDDVYTQEDAYDVDNYVLRLTDALRGVERDVKITYAAGWAASGYATVEIVDYSALTGDSVTVNGTAKTAGADWTAATSNEDTADSLATALNAISGVSAFAVGAVVFVYDDTLQTNSKTITVSDSTNMTLTSGGGDGKLSGTDMPEDLREAVCLMVGGRLAKRKNLGVKSYTIGSKQVTFANEEDAQLFKANVAPYKRVMIRGSRPHLR